MCAMIVVGGGKAFLREKKKRQATNIIMKK
jgi:hypothetical protein